MKWRPKGGGDPAPIRLTLSVQKTNRFYTYFLNQSDIKNTDVFTDILPIVYSSFTGAVSSQNHPFSSNQRQTEDTK